MKRVFLLFVSALLLLPLLAMPCFASAPVPPLHANIMNSVDTDRSAFVDPAVSLPEGVYKFKFNFPAVGMAFESDVVNVQYTYDASLDLDAFWFDVTFSLPTGDFVVPVAVISGDGAASTGTMIYLGAYIPEFAPGAYVSLVPVETGLVNDFGALASAVIDWVGQIAAAIVEHPLLLVTVGIFFAGGCIALFSRFLSRD